jgi:hypothetical protein
MEHARTLEALVPADESPLAHARLHRQLTVDEAARRAGVSPEEVQWLEEGRLYRFPSPDRALLATMLYATALGVTHREALELAGLPVPPKPLAGNPWRRFGAVAAIGAAVAAAALAVVLARSSSQPRASEAATAAATLPAPWAIKVVVLNGSGDIVYTRSVASRIQALSYRIAHVGKAASFNYPQTEVYYPPGGEAIALRLAQQLGVPAQPLPGGLDPRRLVVIVGPQRGPSQSRASPGSVQRNPQRGELLLQRRRHRLGDGLTHVDAEALLEAVPPPAPLALVEVQLGLDPLGLREDVVEVRLHHLLAVRAGICHDASSRTESASSRLRIRRPRCRRDITVPIGMSRICAAS